VLHCVGAFATCRFALQRLILFKGRVKRCEAETATECCSMLRCVAVCCTVLQCLLQRVVFSSGRVKRCETETAKKYYIVMQCVALCYSMLQYVAVLHGVAVYVAASRRRGRVKRCKAETARE